MARNSLDINENEHIEDDELDEQTAELLPDREVMSTISPKLDPVVWDLPVEPRDGV